jgi:hypothetical protein
MRSSSILLPARQPKLSPNGAAATASARRLLRRSRRLARRLPAWRLSQYRRRNQPRQPETNCRTPWSSSFRARALVDQSPAIARHASFAARQAGRRVERFAAGARADGSAPRAEKVAREACVSACVRSAGSHARCPNARRWCSNCARSGSLTSGFLVRIVAFGKIDFFGAALVALVRPQSEARVRSLLADGRDVAMEALFRASGLAASTFPAFVAAIHIWRDVARGKRVAGPQEVSWQMMQVAGEGDPNCRHCCQRFMCRCCAAMRAATPPNYRPPSDWPMPRQRG